MCNVVAVLSFEVIEVCLYARSIIVNNIITQLYCNTAIVPNTSVLRPHFLTNLCEILYM